MDDKVRVAVSGVGGGVGQSIIKALQGTDYEVVALDSEILGTGLYTTSRSYVIPYAKDPHYVDALLEICKKEGCRLLFPGLDAELAVLSEATERFKEVGAQVVVSSPEFIRLSDNKMLTYSSLSDLGIKVPRTIDLAVADYKTIDLSFPFVVKKREGGARSQNVYLIDGPDRLESLKLQGVKLEDFVAQEYIEGDEYTCGSINLDGSCMGVIVMRRTLRDGDTYKCFAVKNPVIENLVHDIMSSLKPFGACNVQLRLKDNVPYVFEINARCSGTTAARALCGFNEPKMIADYLCLNKKPAYEIKEQAILRYWKELPVDNDLIDKLKQDGNLEQEKFILL